MGEVDVASKLAGLAEPLSAPVTDREYLLDILSNWKWRVRFYEQNGPEFTIDGNGFYDAERTISNIGEEVFKLEQYLEEGTSAEQSEATNNTTQKANHK